MYLLPMRLCGLLTVLSCHDLGKAQDVSSGNLLWLFQGNPLQGNPFQGNPLQGNIFQGNPLQGNPLQGNQLQGTLIGTNSGQLCNLLRGQCVEGTRCIGRTVNNLCGGSDGPTCCIGTVQQLQQQQSSVPLIDKCRGIGGTCTKIWLCRGRMILNHCEGSGEECCTGTVQQQPSGFEGSPGFGELPSFGGSSTFEDPEKRCKDIGGTCSPSWLCQGTIRRNYCELGTGKECCLGSNSQGPVVPDFEQECRDQGGMCLDPRDCRGSIVRNYCGTNGKACCFGQSAVDQGGQAQVFIDPGKECKEKGGTCAFSWDCRGRTVSDYCGQDSGQGCCLPQVSPQPSAVGDPEKKCKDIGGSCMQSWLCSHTIKRDLCQQGTTEECCVLAAPQPPAIVDHEQKCKDIGGTCMQSWLCSKTIKRDHCQQGTGEECCVDTAAAQDSGQTCIDKGGVCVESWVCGEVGTIAWGICRQGNGIECCLPRVDNTLNAVAQADKQCVDQGGVCKNTGDCSTKVTLNGMCPAGQKCCFERCEKAGGKCSDENQCLEKIFLGLCLGLKKCCFEPCMNAGGKCLKTEDCPNTFGVASKVPLCNKEGYTCCMMDDRICLNTGGNCKHPSFCRGVKFGGVCPNSWEECCIDSEKVTKPENCENAGGKCMAKQECQVSTGNVVENLCGNGGMVCCFYRDFQCINAGGACTDKAACEGSNRSYVAGLCADDKMTCCFDTCKKAGGVCKDETKCSGKVATGLCGGADNIKCCIAYGQ